VSNLFDEKAKDWDANDMATALSAAVGSTLVKAVELGSHMRVMDFGAGTGLVSSHVAPAVKTVVAVDISAAMLEKLAAKDELQGKVEVVCQDITKQPLDQTFDLIVSAMALHHVEDTDALLQTFAAHLEPGKHVALADLDKEDGSFHPEGTAGVFHSGFERGELQAKLEANGFGDVKFVTAHVVAKPGGDYPVFLVTAQKLASAG